MDRCSALLLLLLLAGGSACARIDYFAVLEDIDIAHRLKLLEPETVLRNYDIVRRQDGRSNRSACERDVALYERAIGKRESWALKMLDSSSRVPIGLLRGHVIDIGMFDECMAVTNTVGNEIRGRHCMYSIKPDHGNETFPINPMLSICLPSSCNDRDVVELFNGAINRSDELRELGLVVTSATCASAPEIELTNRAIVVLTFASLFINFLLVCTWIDVRERRRNPKDQMIPSKKSRLMSQFSILKSAEIILSTKSREGDLAFLHGIRSLSCLWIVLVHEYFLKLFGSINDVMHVTKWYSTRKSVIVFMGLQAVDTFLVISGFLVAYTAFNKMKKTNKFINVPLYYVHRYIRLTLPVAVFVLGSPALMPFIGSGAQFEMIANEFVMKCSSKWWSILLYIQNFDDLNNHCMLHLWSLSVDMQLYWISPLILYSLYKKPKIGLTVVALLLLGSMLSMGMIFRINKYPAMYITLNPNIPLVIKAFNDVYIQTYTRAIPWLVGFYFGYEVTHNNVKPTKNVIYTGWLLATLALTFCYSGTRYFTLESYEYNTFWDFLFPPLSKVFWAFGICWIIYACINNAAGPISTILSWRYFKPLSKISYCIYLLNISFPAVQAATSRTPFEWSDTAILHSYLGNLIMIVVSAFVFSIFFEMPMLVLDSLLFKEKTESQRKDKNEEMSDPYKETQKNK